MSTRTPGISWVDTLSAMFADEIHPRTGVQSSLGEPNLRESKTEALACSLRTALMTGELNIAWDEFGAYSSGNTQVSGMGQALCFTLASLVGFRLGLLPAATKLTDLVLQYVRPLGNARILAEVLHVRGEIEFASGQLAGALQYFEASHHYFSFELNDPVGSARVLSMIALVQKRRGMWSSARDTMRRAQDLLSTLFADAPTVVGSRLLVNIAVVVARQGNLKEAVELLARATAACDATGLESGTKNSRILASDINRIRGDYKMAAQELASIRSWAQQHGDARKEGLCHEYLADVRADQGRPDAAIRHLGRALSLALEKFPETDMVCEAQRRRAEVLVQLGRGAEAREAAEEALRVSSKIAEPYEIGLAHRALGVVLAHEGDGEAALRELARCEEILAELGEKFERARTLLQRGRLLKSTGAAGEAAEALERARQIFTEMELPNWVERVDELLLERELPEAPHLLTGRPLNTPDRFGIITRDPRMLALWQDLTRAAATKLPVLIEGESGTGKELFAQAVHQLSPRQGKEFVPINCGAIPHDMQESELFGHARGSFTGSVDDRPGLFETAHGGTLFLDEIGEMAHTAQVKLLRALETGQVRRIGDRGQRTVDVRYVAATNVGIQAAVAAGRFREDLFHRLDGFAMTIPPLRERRADIPLLVDFFVGRAARENDRDVRVGPALMNRLMAYDWRGNVRELRNKVTRAVMLAGRPGELSVADFPFLLDAGGAAPVTIDQDMDQIERARILKALEETNWSKSAAARLLNVQRTTLHSRMERLGIPIRKPGGRERAH